MGRAQECVSAVVSTKLSEHFFRKTNSALLSFRPVSRDIADGVGVVPNLACAFCNIVVIAKIAPPCSSRGGVVTKVAHSCANGNSCLHVKLQTHLPVVAEGTRNFFNALMLRSLICTQHFLVFQVEHHSFSWLFFSSQAKTQFIGDSRQQVFSLSLCSYAAKRLFAASIGPPSCTVRVKFRCR